MSHRRITSILASLAFSAPTKSILDGIIASLALVLAVYVRYEGLLPRFSQEQLKWLIVPIALLQIALNLCFGVSRQAWRYVSKNEAARLLLPNMLLAALLLYFRFTLTEWAPLRLPLGVIALQFFFSTFGALGIRLLWRTICERQDGLQTKSAPQRVILIGAGFHGVTVAKEMARKKTIEVVGFLDDDSRLHGSRVAGIPVLGDPSILPQMTKRFDVQTVLICVPPSERLAIQHKVHASGNTVKVRVFPTSDEILAQDRLSEQSNTRDSRLGKRSLLRTGVPGPEVSPNSIRDQRILITGGAGFIGSSLAERLVEKNQLVLFDTAFDGKPIQFTKLLQHRNVRAVTGTILDQHELARITDGVDMVVHMAAVLGVGKVCSAARDTLETNYVGTSRLLQVLESKPRLTRFVYFSTSEVFGVNSYRVGEDAPPMIGPIAEARWSYAMGKLAGEHLVQSYFRESKMPTVIVRPFNIFGPRRTGDYALLRFIVNALARKPLIIHGDGSQIRSWCFVEDFCDAVVAMLERPEAIGEDFNIGNAANAITVKDLAKRVVDIAASTSELICVQNPFPDIQIRVPSLDKAERLLGYTPRFELDQALAITIEWCNEHWQQISQLDLPEYNAVRTHSAV